MRKINQVWVTLLMATFCGNALAYETETHEELVDHAYRNSILAEDLVWDILRINPNDQLDLDSNLQLTPFTVSRLDESEFEGSTPLAIIRTGATLEDEVGDEDNIIRPLNHFFDPFNDRALTLGNLILTRESSPVWTIEEERNFRQRRSYRDAQDIYFEALTAQFPSIRNDFMVELFRNLGHVLHHIADMAQSDHVRNDGHLVTNTFIDDLRDELTDPSLYEEYTRGLTRGPLDQNFSDRGLQQQFFDTFNGYEPVQLLTPRDYWNTEGAGNYDGVGLAEFTNREFVSKDTNFGSFVGTGFPRPNIEEDNNLILNQGNGLTESRCGMI